MIRIIILAACGIVTAAKPQAAIGADDKFPTELVDFKPAQDGPVFTAGGKGKWDQAIRERGWIMKEGDVWKLWYTGYDGGRDSIKYLGYATSTDGISWKRHDKNPIYTDHWVEDMMIVKDDGKYWMFAEGKDDRAHLLVSTDGLAWKRVGQLDIRLKDGKPIPDGAFGTPTAWKEKDTWHLFYERDDLGVWLATSKDMKVWTNVQDEPVLRPGPDEFDKDLIALNQIIRHKDRYYAYYHGSARQGPAKGKWSVGVATSTDLIHWEKYAKNPLEPVEQNKSSGILVHDGSRYLLYTMHPAVHVHVPAK